MMPQTVPDGFEFEQFPTDEPGRTLHGGHAGDSPILAEQIQAKFVTTDSQLSDLSARVAALEDGTGGVGWIPIARGSSSGASFSIDMTAGGKYPSPPLWDAVRVYARVDLDAVGEVRMSINGENDNVYRSGSYMIDSEVPSTFDGENWHREAASSWSLAQLSTISTGNLALTLFHTDVNPGLINFQCFASRHSETNTFHRNQMSSGGITVAKTLQSLVFATGNGASTFVNCWWKAEGLRMVAPS
jgi:hypothetical protein